MDWSHFRSRWQNTLLHQVTSHYQPGPDLKWTERRQTALCSIRDLRSQPIPFEEICLIVVKQNFPNIHTEWAKSCTGTLTGDRGRGANCSSVCDLTSSPPQWMLANGSVCTVIDQLATPHAIYVAVERDNSQGMESFFELWSGVCLSMQI